MARSQVEMTSEEFQRLFGAGGAGAAPRGRGSKATMMIVQTPRRPFYPRIRAFHGALIIMALLGWWLQIPALFNGPAILLCLILGYDIHQIRVTNQQIWSDMDRLSRALADATEGDHRD